VAQAEDCGQLYSILSAPTLPKPREELFADANGTHAEEAKHLSLRAASTWLVNQVPAASPASAQSSPFS